MRIRRIAAGLAVGVVALSAAGCAFDPSAVPVPGTTVSGPAYHVRIEFSNVLNLPARAKIMANGAQVGTVSGVKVVNPAGDRAGYVVVDAEISKSVKLPTSTVAELRQNTVLGDIHVALTTPPNGFGALLHDGSTIPVAQSKPPVQLEDTMALVAAFTQGGAVTQLQDVIARINHTLPRDPAQTARISQTMAADAADLANNLDRVDALLHGLGANAQVLHDIQPELDDILSPTSVDRMDGITDSVIGVTKIFGGLGPVGSALTWLGPVLRGADGAVQAFSPLLLSAGPVDLSRPSNLAALVELLRDKVIPFAEHGAKVNIVGVHSDAAPDMPAEQQTDRILATLRMIGVVR
ncbi:MlaD family protein [Nocardia spumae]|uniref:MlaD family protein n=1 Tax=Nocardia spumae TaxID=2887190 RepID=UPI001D147794|nr:MlaD family protein [Nocardia spumae]